MSTRSGTKLDTRDRIADRSLKLFLEKGYAATSVREIAAAVEVTVPAIYYHFDNKDGLLAALVQPLVDDGEELLDRLGSVSAKKRVDEALAGYYDVVTSNLDVFRLVMVDPSVRSHDLAGHRLADQAARFLIVLLGKRPSRRDLVRASAAMGALRRPLRLDEIDVVADREQILLSAKAALDARV